MRKKQIVIIEKIKPLLQSVCKKLRKSEHKTGVKPKEKE